MESIWIRFLKQFAWHALSGGPLIYFGVQFAMPGIAHDGALGILQLARNSYIGLGLLVAAGLVMVPPFAELFAHPLGTLFFPSEQIARPLLSYARVDLYLKGARYDEAAVEFDFILKHDPRQERAIIGRLSLLAQVAHKHEKAEEGYYSALKMIPDGDAHKKLVEAYAMILAKKDLIVRKPRDLIDVTLYIPEEEMPAFAKVI